MRSIIHRTIAYSFNHQVGRFYGRDITSQLQPFHECYLYEAPIQMNVDFFFDFTAVSLWYLAIISLIALCQFNLGFTHYSSSPMVFYNVRLTANTVDIFARETLKSLALFVTDVAAN